MGSPPTLPDSAEFIRRPHPDDGSMFSIRLRPSSGGPPTGSPGARRLPLKGGVIGRKSPPPLRGRARACPGLDPGEGGPPTTSPPPHSSDSVPSASKGVRTGSQPRHLLAAFRIDIVIVAVLQFEISVLFVAAGRTPSWWSRSLRCLELVERSKGVEGSKGGGRESEEEAVAHPNPSCRY